MAQTSLSMKQKQNQGHREPTGMCQGDMGLGKGGSGSMRLADVSFYIEWINNKVLLYSTENYIQYPMINHSGKRIFLKECTYMYVCMYVCI